MNKIILKNPKPKNCTNLPEKTSSRQNKNDVRSSTRLHKQKKIFFPGNFGGAGTPADNRNASFKRRKSKRARSAFGE